MAAGRVPWGTGPIRFYRHCGELLPRAQNSIASEVAVRAQAAQTWVRPGLEANKVEGFLFAELLPELHEEADRALPGLDLLGNVSHLARIAGLRKVPCDITTQCMQTAFNWPCFGDDDVSAIGCNPSRLGGSRCPQVTLL